MTKNKKIIIAASLLILATFAFVIYFSLFQVVKEPEMPDGSGYNSIAAPAKLDAMDELDSVFGLDTSERDPNRFDSEHIVATTVAPDYKNIDFSVDMERLFGDDSQKYSYNKTSYDSCGSENSNMALLNALECFDDNALTVTFDSIDIRAGMTVGDITNNSYWYTVREEDIIAPGAAAFVCLENDYWSGEEFKLTDENNAQNGYIVLWVHNYSDIQLPVKHCVIYKFQISYLGCYDQFYRHPEISYRDDYYLGSNSFYDSANSITTITTDNGTCTRYTYGDISECQVLLDADDNGLMGITISYNEFYGPEFDEGR